SAFTTATIAVLPGTCLHAMLKARGREMAHFSLRSTLGQAVQRGSCLAREAGFSSTLGEFVKQLTGLRRGGSLQDFDGTHLAQALGRWCPLLDFLEELLDPSADFCGWIGGKGAAQSWLGQLAQRFQLGGRGRPHLELVAVQVRDELLDLGVC